MTARKPPLAPLGMTCSETDCEHGLHYFKPTKRNPDGHCQDCGVDLVDWNRLHKRDIADVEYTVHCLHFERIRHHFWSTDIDAEAMRKATKLTPEGLRLAVEKRIRSKAIAGMPNAWDGRQTSKSGNVICYAQHATACCCRKCIGYWHGIPRDRELNEDELAYLIQLMTLYLRQRGLLPVNVHDRQLQLLQGDEHE